MRSTRLKLQYDASFSFRLQALRLSRRLPTSCHIVLMVSLLSLISAVRHGNMQDNYTVGGDAERASQNQLAKGNPAAPPNPPEEDSAVAGGGSESNGAKKKRKPNEMTEEGGAGAAGSSSGAGDGKGSNKRPKTRLEINQANIVEVLKRFGARLSSKVMVMAMVGVTCGFNFGHRWWMGICSSTYIERSRVYVFCFDQRFGLLGWPAWVSFVPTPLPHCLAPRTVRCLLSKPFAVG